MRQHRRIIHTSRGYTKSSCPVIRVSKINTQKLSWETSGRISHVVVRSVVQHPSIACARSAEGTKPNALWSHRRIVTRMASYIAQTRTSASVNLRFVRNNPAVVIGVDVRNSSLEQGVDLVTEKVATANGISDLWPISTEFTEHRWHTQRNRLKPLLRIRSNTKLTTNCRD